MPSDAHPSTSPSDDAGGKASKGGTGSERTTPGRKKRKVRDLKNAVTLRPRDVFDLFGIPTCTLSVLCRHPDPAKRLPSMLIPGRCGRKGLRLINHAKLIEFLAKWECN